MSIEANQPALHEEFQKLNLEVVEEGYVAALVLQPTLESEIQAAQLKDPAVAEIKHDLQNTRKAGFTQDLSGLVMQGQQLYVPDNRDIKDLILREAHDLPLSIHPGSTKMYRDL